MSTHTDPQSMDELALRAGADIRLPLLRTLVDLYLEKPAHTGEEAQHFTELTLRLLGEADVETRIAVAQRLASYSSVPSAISQWLTNDVPEVAALVRPAGSSAAPAHERDTPTQPGVSPAELSELFFAASAAERRLILVNLFYVAGPAASTLTSHAREAARQLERAALARNPDAFMRALERWLGIGPALARRIVLDPLGEPIVVAAKVLGIATDALQRILLFVNPAVGRSVYRVYELAMLFETIQAQAAHALVGIWRAADPPPVGKSAPADADGGVRHAALPRTAGAQRNPGSASPRVAGSKR